MELGEKKQRSEEPSTKLSVLHSMMFCDQGFNFEKDKCLIMQLRGRALAYLCTCEVLLGSSLAPEEGEGGEEKTATFQRTALLPIPSFGTGRT